MKRRIRTGVGGALAMVAVLAVGPTFGTMESAFAAAAASPSAAIPAQVDATSPSSVAPSAVPTTAATAPGSSAVPTTAAVAAPPTGQTEVGDPKSIQRVRRIVLTLVILAGVLLVITVLFWRGTRPVPKPLERLSVMDSTSFRKAGMERRAELLERPRPLAMTSPAAVGPAASGGSEEAGGVAVVRAESESAGEVAAVLVESGSAEEVAAAPVESGSAEEVAAAPVESESAEEVAAAPVESESVGDGAPVPAASANSAPGPAMAPSLDSRAAVPAVDPVRPPIREAEPQPVVATSERDAESVGPLVSSVAVPESEGAHPEAAAEAAEKSDSSASLLADG